MLSIIIVNWNSKDYVRACLRSLERHATIEHEVVVVDGASFDGCGEMLRADFPKVRFVQSEQNLGFGRCNNLGAEHATGDLLLFLNPDTEIFSGSLEALLEVLRTTPAAGLVGARLLNTDGSLQTSCVQSLPTPLNQALDSNFLRRMFPNAELWGTADAFAATEPVVVPAVSGACMLIPRETFERIGGFCPDYFMYAEDMHLCWDVARLGLRVVYQPAAVITHHGGGASGGEFSCRSCLSMRHAVHHFIEARQGRAAGVTYRLLMALSAVCRLGCLGGRFLITRPAGRSRVGASIRRWWTNLRWAAGGMLRRDPDDRELSTPPAA